MKTRTILILTVSLVILSVLYYIDYGRSIEQQKADWQRQHLLPKDGVEKIQSFRIRRPDLDVVITKTQDGNWEITQPIQAQADNKVVTEGLLNTLAEASRYGQFEMEEAKKADFGFDESAIKVTVEFKDNAPVNFVMGNDAPIPGEVYITMPDQPGTAYVTGKSLRDAFDKDLLQLRDKTMLSFDMNDIDIADFIVNGTTTTLNHEDMDWTLTGPNSETYKADPAVLREIIGAIKNMQAVTLDNNERLDQPAPGHPDLQVIFKTKTSDAPTTILLRAATTDGGLAVVDETSGQTPYYAIAAENGLHYAVEKPLLAALTSPITTLRDRHLVRLDTQEIAWLQVEWNVQGEQPVAYAFMRNEAGGWALTSDPEKPLHQIRILEYITILTRVRVEDFDLKSPPPENVAGLEEPALRVTLSNADRSKTEGFEIGNARTGTQNQYYGRRLTSSGEALPTPHKMVGVEMVEGILNSLRKPSDFFVRKPLINFDLENLGGIEVSIKGPETTTTIAVVLRQTDDRVAWVGQINDEKPRMLPQNTVSSYVSAVYGLEYLVEYSRNVDENTLGKYDLIAPSNRIRVFDKEGQVIGGFEFGNPKMGQAIIVRDLDGEYYFVQIKVLQLFQKALEQVAGRLRQ